MDTKRTSSKAALLALALAASCVASAAPASPARPGPASCQILRADEAWRGSGVSVNPEQFVCVAAAGLWSHGIQGIQLITPYYGPEGFAKDDPVNVPEVVARTGALIGRIGANPPFVIGNGLCFIPSTTGELMLSMNDNPGAFGNNAGAVRIAISTWPAATPLARIQAHRPACRPH